MRLWSQNLGRKKYRQLLDVAHDSESYVWLRRLCVDLSLRDACFGKSRRRNKRSFTPSKVDARWKGDDGKRMKGSHKEGTQKQKVRKVHFVALMDVRHIQKYEYIPDNVREISLKCGHEYECIQGTVRKGSLKCGNKESSNWDYHTRSCWRLSPRRTSTSNFWEVTVFPMKSGNFHWTWSKNTHFTDENQRTNR